MSSVYGQLESEKLAKDSQIAREMIKEINQFGINDRQRWLLIYYLSLELENVEEMQAIASYIKEVKGSDIFLSKIYTKEEDG